MQLSFTFEAVPISEGDKLLYKGVENGECIFVNEIGFTTVPPPEKTTINIEGFALGYTGFIMPSITSELYYYKGMPCVDSDGGTYSEAKLLLKLFTNDELTVLNLPTGSAD